MLLTPLASFRKRLLQSSRRHARRRTSKQRPQLAAQVERLEDRTLLSTTYSVVDLGTFGGDRSHIGEINEAGQMVGVAETPDDVVHAFVVDPKDISGDGQPDTWFEDGDGDGINDLMTDLGTLGGSGSVVNGLNESGQVLGKDRNADGDWRPYIVNPKDSNDNGVPDTWFEDSDDDGINDLMTNLHVADTFGASSVSSVRLTGTGDRGRGSPLNESGQVSGWVTMDDGTERAFVVTPEDTDGDGSLEWFQDDGNGGNALLTELPSTADFPNAKVRGINDSGHVVGHVYEDVDDSKS